MALPVGKDPETSRDDSVTTISGTGSEQALSKPDQRPSRFRPTAQGRHRNERHLGLDASAMPLGDTEGHVQLILVDQDAGQPIVPMSRETAIGLIKNLHKGAW